MEDLSVVIATYNEEKNIARAINSIKDLAEEIIVIDGSSTDKTVEIARGLGAKVTVAVNPTIFHINKQKGLNLSKCKWILQLDADEEVTEDLRNEIRSVIEQKSEYAGYYIPRLNYFLGGPLKKGGAYPDPVIRLFLRGRGKFPCKDVHEQIDIDGKVGVLSNYLIHRPYKTFQDYLIKAERYTDLTSEQYAQDKIPVTLINSIKFIVLKPIYIFFNIYFRHLGFMDGWRGFVWAFFSGLHPAYAYLKYLKKTRLI